MLLAGGDGPGTHFDRNSGLLGPQLAQDAANAAKSIAVGPYSPRMPSSLILGEVLVSNWSYQLDSAVLSQPRSVPKSSGRTQWVIGG